MSQRFQRDPEDYFTSLSFKNLITELDGKENCRQNINLNIPKQNQMSPEVCIKPDFDRFWNGRLNAAKISRIFE